MHAYDRTPLSLHFSMHTYTYAYPMENCIASYYNSLLYESYFNNVIHYIILTLCYIRQFTFPWKSDV